MPEPESEQQNRSNDPASETDTDRQANQADSPQRHEAFHRLRPGVIVADSKTLAPKHFMGRLVSHTRRLVFGTPIPSSESLGERVSVPRGLAIFASDNISSSAYATEEIMRVLVLAGFTALALTLPLTLAILVVMAIVIGSYLQIIHAYPDGGGSYIVSRTNLGPLAGLVAAAALLIDYILTVAVSVSAGIAALSSAIPELHGHRVSIAVCVIVLMTLVNLRGVRETGRVFVVPLYLYLGSMFGLLTVGLVRYFTGSLPEYVPPPDWLGEYPAEPLALLLVLRAFSSGAVALTGTEAISNGVPVFSTPSVRKAQTTLIVMGTIFATIFLGVSLLASTMDIVPDPGETQTVISQIARLLLGDGIFFYFVQFSTVLLLILAGNTAFNGFPILASILARDRYLPRQFSFRGDRLSFTAGVLVLAMLAIFLVWVYAGSVTGLIPLYTVGVFVAFSLSQFGMVRHWWDRRSVESGWSWRLTINLIGAIGTAIVAIVVGVTKFLLGAWMVFVLVFILVWMMWNINRHYARVAAAESGLPEVPLDPKTIKNLIVVPVANFRLPARQAIAFALSIAQAEYVTVVHVTDLPEVEDSMREQWQTMNLAANFIVIESQYRSLLAPLTAYIDAQLQEHPDATINVVLPEYVPHHWWEHLLHNQTALRIRGILFFHRRVVVTSIPYHLQE